MRSKPRIAVVIPCFQVEREIEGVVRSIPENIETIILVDDASTDGTAEVLRRLERANPAVVVVSHEVNQGVGGAMKSGFELALRGAAEIVVKVDGDGQMNLGHLPALIKPLVEGRAVMSKGNRLRSFESFSEMPRIRLIGNIGLTFLTKLATGYWHVFDVQNGFLALRREALETIPLDRLSSDYFFENSLLGWLGVFKKPVIDVPMPAVYGEEKSHLRPWRTFFSFPPRLALLFCRRICLRYLVYDVSPVAIYLILGLVGLLFGILFGGFQWYQSITSGVPASTGTVMLALLPFLMGFNLTLQALHMDIEESPRPRRPCLEVDPQRAGEEVDSSKKGIQ